MGLWGYFSQHSVETQACMGGNMWAGMRHLLAWAVLHALLLDVQQAITITNFLSLSLFIFLPQNDVEAITPSCRPGSQATVQFVVIFMP